MAGSSTYDKTRQTAPVGPRTSSASRQAVTSMTGGKGVVAFRGGSVTSPLATNTIKKGKGDFSASVHKKTTPSYKNKPTAASGGLGFQAYGNPFKATTAHTGIATPTKVRDKQYGSGASNFSDAFKAARQSGASTFDWNGKKYNTKVKGTTSSKAVVSKKTAPAPAKKATIKATSAQARTTKSVARPASAKPKAAPAGRNTTNSSSGAGNLASKGMTPAMKASMGL